MNASDLQPGLQLFYYPAPVARRPPVLATIPDGPLPAVVHYVHNERLVDLTVQVPRPGDGVQIDCYVRFVPFLHPGDPDPETPAGRCHVGKEHAGRDDSLAHAIFEGRAPSKGETVEHFAARTGRTLEEAQKLAAAATAPAPFTRKKARV